MYKAALFYLTLCLSACSSMPSAIWFESTDHLIQQHQYKQAIHQINRTEPLDKAKLKRLQQKANLHRRQQLKQFQVLLSQKQWHQADALLFHLNNTLPAHPQLVRAKQTLTQLRNKEQIQLASNTALAQADLLKQQAKHALFDYRNTQSTLFWWQSDTPLQTEKKQLAKQLIALTRKALSFDDFKLAKQTYDQALSLNQRLEAPAIQRVITKGLAHKSANTLNQRQTRLIEQLNQAIQEEDFDAILTLTTALSKPAFKNKAAKKAVKKAQRLLMENAKELDQLGDALYRQGDIQAATQVWRQAQAQVPDLPQLKDKISRAQKIQRKLESLRKNQK